MPPELFHVLTIEPAEAISHMMRFATSLLDCCVLGADHTRWSGWQQPTLLGKQMRKHRFGGLPVYEAFMDIEQQLLNQRLGLLTTRFPDGFDGDAPFYR